MFAPWKIRIRTNLDLVSPRIWVGLTLAWLAWIWMFINGALYIIFPAGWGFYGVQPLLWLSLAGLSWLGLRSLPEKPKFSRRIAQWSTLAGLLQVVIFGMVSLPFPFGRSPYGHDFWTVLGNFFYIISFTAGIAVCRAFLGAAIGVRHPGRAWAGISILMTVVLIPAAQFSQLGTASSSFPFLGQTLLPDLSKNLLATYLAMTSGPLASAGYLLVLTLAEWLPPILPNPPWLVTAVLGTIFPILVLYGFNRWLAPSTLPDLDATQPIVNKRNNQGELVLWCIVGLVGLGMVGFTTGLFGARPFIVSGGSMNPALFAGDIVVISPVKAAELSVGDIIHYQKSGAEVVHRIVKFIPGPLEPLFITRGDNNNTDDPPVRLAEIRGKVILVIPKLGLLGIAVRNVSAAEGGAE